MVLPRLLFNRENRPSKFAKKIEAKNYLNIQIKFHEQLTQEDLKLFDTHKNWKVEKGKFKVLVGNSSDSIKLESAFMLNHDYPL
ncbi:fibronectin type III-like domain-contianing protein [Sphingobacterium sp. SYP-B4668]|uniref:fibronectin type III-like domain-contianing protein n=1 Tax=Sphingobacterium sp. SYP-B4668 TaxID=2996035 RepID=UPI003FA6E2C7